MPFEPQQWDPGKAGDDMPFFDADFTKRVFRFLSALGKMRVFITGLPGASGRVVATLDDVGINLTLPNPVPPGGYMCSNASSDSVTQIRVRYAVTNNVKGDPGMTLGDVTPFYVTPAGASGVIYEKVTVDSSTGLFDPANGSSLIACAASIPADSFPDFYRQLGSYGTRDDGSLAVTPGGQGTGIGDQSFELCGGVEPLWGPA